MRAGLRSNAAVALYLTRESRRPTREPAGGLQYSGVWMATYVTAAFCRRYLELIRKSRERSTSSQRPMYLARLGMPAALKFVRDEIFARCSTIAFLYSGMCMQEGVQRSSRLVSLMQ